MFDRVMDLLAQVWHWLVPLVIIHEFERGVRFRFGKNPVLMEPGLHIVMPLAIDTVLVDYCVSSTLEMNPQSLTTLDGKQVVVTLVVVYHIEDMIKYQLRSHTPSAVVEDCIYGVVSEEIESWNYEDTLGQTTELAANIQKAASERAAYFGISLDNVMFKDYTTAKSFRLFQATYDVGE